MAYETPLLPTYDYEDTAYDPTFDSRRGDAVPTEYDGQLIRPYLGAMGTDLYESDLGIDTYDPLTAPLAEVAEREYGSQAAYDNAPTLWDRQSERAHLWASERAAVLGGLRRVCEYRAQFPTDTDTIQLRIVEPAPSSVDVALAELRQLREEIAWHKDNPPLFSRAQTLHAKYDYEQTLQLRIPDIDPANKNMGPGPLPTASPATLREPTRSGEGYANNITAEPEASGWEQADMRAASRPRRKLGPVGRSNEPSRLWRIASLSTRGAKQLLGRLKRQAGF